MRYALYLFAAILLLFSFWGCQNSDSLVDPSADSSINPGNADGETDVVIPVRWYWICGTVFDDENLNGVQDGNEAGLPNVTVNLQGNGSTSTDADGEYCFRVLPGNYVVEVETFDPYFWETTPNPVNVAVPFASVYGVDFGLTDTNPNPGPVDTYSICGTVYVREGFRNWPPTPNRTVWLWDGNAWSNTVTDQNGNYCFNDLEDGDYSLWTWDYQWPGFWRDEDVTVNGANVDDVDFYCFD
jgi:hypothetical protein